MKFINKSVRPMFAMKLTVWVWGELSSVNLRSYHDFDATKNLMIVELDI